MAPRCAHPVALIALLLFGLVALLLLTITTEDVREAPVFMYGIVLDAGSSHTALYIYKWPADKQNGTGVVTQHGECHFHGGGISSYAGQQGAAGRSLEACLDQAVKDIPKERHRLTPVYLGATAGMRLLHMSSPELSAQILQEVGNKIQSYPFNFQGATVLSGQSEGAYGWVTVNYLLENFIKYGFVGRWLSPGRPTVGALDFGGASTQITFATGEEVENERDVMKMRLYGQEYSLYTHSFLCYGQDQMLKRLLAHIVKSQGYSGSVTHPCYPAGHNRTLQLTSVFNSPCTAQYKPSSPDPQATLTVHGSGHYERCLGNVSQIFSFQRCPYSRCSFDGVFQPNVSGSFMMLLLAPEQSSRLQDYCAISVFVKVLMMRGYGFDDTSFPRIAFQKKAGDASVGWALGYMLRLSSLLPAEREVLRKALTPGTWGALIGLFVLLLAAVLVFIILQARGGKKKSAGESPI
ncbi:ectonucleoside triphosphate diphosphohydrolase 2 isoform X2 [Pseudoliparis swirei]|uniref:ectonucleoside triphosphate diphosphohydrolase 2 isoform X2 n=1 Tax=Pseudoliparis swirei TaxID=2059687 RepID=UPI0024BE5A59|nr:ectonucleoside triphosphate diphosphohydrolase 2 isoform X2 [Pseudoliparis swirei]